MLFFEIVDGHPADSTALICRDKLTTYGELGAMIEKWAGALQARGVVKNDRVGLFSKNCTEFVAAYMAITKAGGVVVPINFQLSPYEAAYILKDASIRLLVVNEKLELEQALHERKCEPVEQVSFEELAAAPEHDFVSPKIDERDNCAIIYTSGTTGFPKGAMLSHRNLVANTIDFTKVVKMYAEDVSFCVLPMYHCFAWTVTVAGPLYHGAAIVIQANYTLPDTLRLIAKYNVNQFIGVPTMIQMFEKGAEPEQLKNIRFFVSGGASLHQKLSNDFQKKFNRPVQEGYGLSEASPVCTVNPAEKIKVGSIGLPLPNVEIQIRDENDKELPVGIVGEMCVKGANVMMGYLNLPEATQDALRGGWLHTGDLAYKDEEGYIFIVDRLKDMIITSGENVYPREVEEVIYTYPGVSEAAVIAAPDKLRGQVVCAYVVMKEGFEASKPQLRRFLMERLALYKVPKYYFFCEQLPKNPTGKVLKTALREKAAAELLRQ